MRRLYISFALLLSMLTAEAQYGIRVWKDGKSVLFPIANVDSIRFVRPVTDIYFSDDVVELKEGETRQLTVSVLPVDADTKDLTWSSSTPSVASVDAQGFVTAVSIGTSLITVVATDDSGVKAECQVTVKRLCPDDHHPHVIDLGLPSGTKWCCCNVGASTPEGYGGYYAWGETSEKSAYNWDAYAYYNKDTGYVNIGSDIAGTSYDVATVLMGAPWRMPSAELLLEFVNYCSRQWTMLNGVNGILVTGLNGAQIFLPAAGYQWIDDLEGAGSYGYYWSSSLYPSHDGKAYGLYIGPIEWYWSNKASRGCGRSVRAVCGD